MVIKLSTPYDTNPPLLAAHRLRNQARIAENRQASPTRRVQPATGKQNHAKERTISSRKPTCVPRVTNHPNLGTKWLSRERIASPRFRLIKPWPVPARR